MITPTRRLALSAVVVSAAVALVSHGSGWLMVGADIGLLVAAGVDAVLALSPGSVGVSRELPAAVTLGAAGEVVWRVSNPSARRLTVAIADELAPSLRAGRRRLWLRLAPRATTITRTAIEPSRRGRFEPRRVAVRVLGPLGLAARQGDRDLPGELRVLPVFRSRAQAELRIDRARILEIGLRSAQGRGGGTEFESLRDYTVDDEFRRIDWPATARSGRAIVRTYRAERNQTVIMLLDTGRVMAGRVDDVPRLEHAMDAALCVTAVATRLGDRVGLVAFDRQVRAVVAPSHTGGQLARMTEAIYALEPRLVESDYRGAFAETLSRWRRRSLLVVLSELTDEAVTETLLPAVPLLGRRHVVVVASVSDADVVRWAGSVPTEVDAAYRKAAALATLDRRERTAVLLRATGATVVDAPPGMLAGRLADAYLEVKAAGRL